MAREEFWLRIIKNFNVLGLPYSSVVDTFIFLLQGSEVCDAIVRIMMKSSTIEEIVLDSASFGR